MLNKISTLKVSGPYSIEIHFADRALGVHDFSELVHREGQMIEPLRDPDYFARAFVEQGALTWPNGFDLCADALRKQMEMAGELHFPQIAE